MPGFGISRANDGGSEENVFLGKRNFRGLNHHLSRLGIIFTIVISLGDGATCLPITGVLGQLSL